MSASPARIDLRSTRVLVVDDHAQSLELLSQMLLGFGVSEVVACRSPQEAWAEVTSKRFDLILLDLDMPGDDGLSVTRRIRREADHPNGTAPIVILSGHTPLEGVHEARDAGANLVVRKPVAASELLSRIIWLARTPRRFVSCANYCGPDRRFKNGPPPVDVGERRVEDRALASAPERALSQADVDTLFG
jgi:CheY-like chemotaxis protein